MIYFDIIIRHFVFFDIVLRILNMILYLSWSVVLNCYIYHANTHNCTHFNESTLFGRIIVFGEIALDNILLKKIEKTALIFAAPLVIILLLYFNNQPEIAVAFLIGMFLGVFRLKALFGYYVNGISGQYDFYLGFNRIFAC